MLKKYIVRLTDAERQTLSQVVAKFKGSSQKVRRAQVLLKADADGPAWTDAKIADAFGCRTKTVENIRGRFVTQGFEVTLNGQSAEIAGRQEGSRSHRTASGAAASGLCELDVALVGRAGRGVGDCGVDQLRDGASDAQKNGMTKRKIAYWVIPPEADGEYVAALEEVLETYAQPYDPRQPVLCMDEQPVQLLKETRVPIAATKDHARRVDYEYERAGTASVFLFCEPLSGWRQVAVRQQRTKIDWAREVEELLRTRYASAEKVILVCDNLNTHTKGAFYDVFDPETARAIVRRLDFRYTPKHGSWLNIAESELSAMTRQCFKDRRFATIEELRKETTAWHQRTNARQRGVDWQFRIDDARVKLKSVYPKIIV